MSNENKVEEIKVEEKEKEKEKYKSSLSTILKICGKALEKHDTIHRENIILIVHSVMESIETLKQLKAIGDLKGEEKKQLCIDCLHWIIDHQQNLEMDERGALHLLVDSVAPTAIDVIISVSNGLSDLVSSVTKKMSNCLARCF
jgi:hypothetical protein